MYTSALHIHADTTLASVHSMTAEAERGGNRKPALIPRQGQSQRRKSSLLNPGSSVSMEGENSTREWQGRSLQRLKDIFLWNTLQRPTSLSIFLAKKKKLKKKLFSKEMPAGHRWNTVYDNTQPSFQWWINSSRTSCAPHGNWCLARSSELWIFSNRLNWT